VSSKGEVGENISMRKSTSANVTLSGTEVSKQWYDDSKNYDYVKGSGPAGNFTQMIWKATEEVGFGVAHSKGKCIVVGHYKPPGNVKGCYIENVQPLNTTDLTHFPEQSQKVPLQCTFPVKKDISQDKALSVFMTPLTHSRSSSMSGDDSFELEIQSQPDICKAEQRQLRQFVRETIASINKYREKHRVPKLKHNKELDTLSQNWANELVHKSTLSNSKNAYKGDRVGENVASRWSNGKCDYTADQVADHWYAENSKFSYDKEPPNVQGIGNFTQMVWKSSKEIGIGKAFLTKDNDSRVIVVCNYYPAGNVLRHFLENVLPPNSS